MRLALVGSSGIERKGDAVIWTAGMAIDADGSPHAYNPQNTGLDNYKNAGYPKYPRYYRDILVCDREDNPFLQDDDDPAPGYFISMTAYVNKGFERQDPHRYLDSEKVRYLVVPPQVITLVKPIVLGCLAEIKNLRTGKKIKGMVGDIGPRTKLGEASIATARALGIDSNPRIGGTEEKIIQYSIYPGFQYKDYPLQKFSLK